jgi:hypothetical protein
MENVSNISSEEELLQLRDEGKISEAEYNDLLGAMRKSMPSEPEEPATQMYKADPKHRLGKIAFYLMLAGIILPIVGFFFSSAATGWGDMDVIFKVCFIICVLFEMLAFVVGVISWPNVFGKATVVTISVFAVLYIATSVPSILSRLVHQRQAMARQQDMLIEQHKLLSQEQHSLAVSGAVELKRFDLDDTEGLITQTGGQIDKKISSDGNGSLRIEATEPTTIRLFETGDIDIEDARLIYQARVRTENVEGQVYLEIRCRFSSRGFPGIAESFSKGLANSLSGTTDWTTQETPFLLQKGENPDNVKLNLVIEGKGTVWIDDIRLLKGPPQ